MRVLVLHSDVAPDAPADELDTLITAQAVADALEARGHCASMAPIALDPAALRASVAEHRAELVFNMVEAIFQRGELAPTAPALLEQLNVPYTGCGATAMALAGDKPLAKKVLRLAGLPTPDWHEWPFDNAPENFRHIVKSATEDASIGLDAGAVVAGREAIRRRALACRREHGGRWFAELYVEGREFNISILEENGRPRLLPIAEMVFREWPPSQPRIVGYDAKWKETSPDYRGTERRFGGERDEPALYAELAELSQTAWGLFALKGYARIDFRVTATGEPTILEINPNPCLEPNAGLAAAAAEAGSGYADAIEQIAMAAISRAQSLT